jgi:hypothetical protein
MESERRLGMKKQDKPVDEMQIVDVEIENVSALPAHYFMRPSVIEALRREVRSDVVSKDKPMPAGARGLYGSAWTMMRGLRKNPASGKAPYSPARELQLARTAVAISIIAFVAVIFIFLEVK